MKLSVICPTNDRGFYESHVGAWLQRQICRDFEEIVVDAREGRYASAADALNAGAAQASGDYYVFLHQDVVVDDAMFLTKLMGWIDSIQFAIAGAAGTVAGTRPWRRVTYTNVLHGVCKKYPWGSPTLANAMDCETVDECFFVVPRQVYRQHPFRNICNSWHLYAAEFCLWAATHQVGPVVAFPLPLWHLSSGRSLDGSYYCALWQLANTYRGRRNWIHTPMGAWPTNGALLLARILLDVLRNKVWGRHDD